MLKAQGWLAEVAAPVEVAAAAAAPAVVRSGQELPWGIQGSDVSARFTGQVFYELPTHLRARFREVGASLLVSTHYWVLTGMSTMPPSGRSKKLVPEFLEGIIHDQNVRHQPLSSPRSRMGNFAATVKALIERNPQYLFQQTNLITFAPQARSAWHYHGPMYLIGIGGLGYYQAEGQDAILIKPGDVVFCPPDVRHWHGAAPNSWFAQIVIYDSAYVPEQPWPESAEVTAEEYQQATAAQ